MSLCPSPATVLLLHSVMKPRTQFERNHGCRSWFHMQKAQSSNGRGRGRGRCKAALTLFFVCFIKSGLRGWMRVRTCAEHLGTKVQLPRSHILKKWAKCLTYNPTAWEADIGTPGASWLAERKSVRFSKTMPPSIRWENPGRCMHGTHICVPTYVNTHTQTPHTRTHVKHFSQS